MKKCLGCDRGMSSQESGNMCSRCEHEERLNDKEYYRSSYQAAYSNDLFIQELTGERLDYGRAARDAEVATQGYW